MRLKLVVLASVVGSVAAASLLAQRPSQWQQRRAEAAHNDSYPEYVHRWARVVDPDPRVGRVMPIGTSAQLCVFARNRYTNKVRIIVSPDVSSRTAAQIDATCDVAYRMYTGGN